MARLRLLLLALVLGVAAAPSAQAPPAVVLVTLDGARTEEVFGGLDVEVVKSQLHAVGQRAARCAHVPLRDRPYRATPPARDLPRARRDRRLGARRPLRPRARRVLAHGPVSEADLDVVAVAARLPRSDQPAHHDRPRAWSPAVRLARSRPAREGRQRDVDGVRVAADAAAGGVRDHTPLTTSQVAATLVRWAGFDWKAFDPAAAPCSVPVESVRNKPLRLGLVRRQWGAGAAWEVWITRSRAPSTRRTRSSARSPGSQSTGGTRRATSPSARRSPG